MVALLSVLIFRVFRARRFRSDLDTVLAGTQNPPGLGTPKAARVPIGSTSACEPYRSIIEAFDQMAVPVFC